MSRRRRKPHQDARRDARAPIDIRPKIALVLAGLMCTAPFLNPHHGLPIPIFYPAWTAIALGTGALFVLVVRKPGEVARVPYMAVGFFGLALVLLLQIAIGRIAVPEHSVTGIFCAVWAGMLAWLGACLRERLGLQLVVRYLQVFLVAGAILVAGSGLVQYYGWTFIVDHFSAAAKGMGMFGYVGQRNTFANYLACGLASVLFLYGRTRLKTGSAVLLAMPLALGLVLSGSRSAWVFLLIVLAAAAWSWWRSSEARPRRLAGFAAFLLVTVVFLQVLAQLTPLLQGSPDQRFATGGERLAVLGQEDPGLQPSVRAYLWEQAWLIFTGSPFLGVGFGEFAWNLFLHAVSFDGKQWVVDAHSHNAVLQLLAEAGIAGALCLAVPLLMWARRFPWREASLEHGWLLAVLGIELAHSMVEFPLWIPGFLGIAALLFGIGSQASLEFRFTRIAQAAIAAVLAVGTVVLIQAFLDYRSFERWFSAQAAARSQRSAPVAPFARPSRIAATSPIVPYYDLLAVETIRPDRDNLESKLALNARAMHFFPVPTAALRHAILLHLHGDRDAAMTYLARIAVIYPNELPRFLAILERLAVAEPALFAFASDARREFGQLSRPPP